MSNVTEKILKEYEELEKINDSERRNRISSVYEKYPKIKEIDDKIKNCGITCLNKILSNPSSADEVNSFIEDEMEKLKSERNSLIEDFGIDPMFDKIKYKCEMCSDTGFVGNEKCKCFIQKIMDEEFNNSNMGEKQKNCTFDKFKLDIYSKTESQDGITHYERMSKIYNLAKDFTENFDTAEKSLFFYGGTGVGKTFLSSCIANELMKKGKTVLYARASRLFELFERNHFGRGDIKKDRELIERVYTCDLLIVDDLGTEIHTRNIPSFLYDFFDERVSNNKKLIINTNYNSQELEDLYTKRFTSRLFESFYVLKFAGKDLRIGI